MSVEFECQSVHIGCLFSRSLTTISTSSVDWFIQIYYFLPEYIFVIYIYLEQYFIWDFRFIGITLYLLFLMNHMDLKLYFFWLSDVYVFLLLSFWIRFETKFTVLLVFKKLSAFCLLKISRRNNSSSHIHTLKKICQN